MFLKELFKSPGDTLPFHASWTNCIIRPEEITEATNYANMFARYVDPKTTDSKQVKTTDSKQVKLRNEVNAALTWAKKTLKREDRIVWFLRIVRINLFGQPALDEFNKKFKQNWTMQDALYDNLKSFEHSLEHYFALPIKKIQDYVFGLQTISEIFEQFDEMEETWKIANEKKVTLIDMEQDDDAEPIIEFPDGYVWFNLNRSGCSIEANAMGHCGNGQGRRGENLLSLRKPVERGGIVRWYPVLTFILDENGLLGEMKGRGNNKPVERYHKYIVALLKHEMVNGIKGGGYKPENNFHLNDLLDDEKESLIQEKPELAGPEYFYKKEGMTKRVLRLIESALEAKNYYTNDLVYEPEQKRFIVQDFGEFQYFLRDMNDTACEQLLEFCEGEDDLLSTKSMEESFKNFVHNLDHEKQEVFLRKTGTNDIVLAAEDLINKKDDLFLNFLEAVKADKELREKGWERLAEYAKLGWYGDAMNVYLEIPDTVAELKAFINDKKDVCAYVDETDMMDYYATTDDDEDSEYTLRNWNGEHYMWFADEGEYNEERRKEEGLIKKGLDKHKRTIWVDAWLTDLPKDGFIEAAYFKQLHSSNYQKDERQHEMSFESEMRKLLNIITEDAMVDEVGNIAKFDIKQQGWGGEVMYGDGVALVGGFPVMAKGGFYRKGAPKGLVRLAYQIFDLQKYAETKDDKISVLGSVELMMDKQVKIEKPKPTDSEEAIKTISIKSELIVNHAVGMVNIELIKKKIVDNRRQGTGTVIVKSLIESSPLDYFLVFDIQKKALGFWKKMGCEFYTDKKEPVENPAKFVPSGGRYLMGVIRKPGSTTPVEDMPF